MGQGQATHATHATHATAVLPGDVWDLASEFLAKSERTDMQVALGSTVTVLPVDEVLNLGNLGHLAQQPETAERAAKVTRLIIRVDAQSPRDDLSNLPAMPSLRSIELDIIGFPSTGNDWMQQFLVHIPWAKVQTLVVRTTGTKFNAALTAILHKCTRIKRVALRRSSVSAVQWSPEVISALTGEHAVVEVCDGKLPNWDTSGASEPRVRQLDLVFLASKGSQMPPNQEQTEFWRSILRSAELESLRLLIKDEKYAASCNPRILQDKAVIAAQKRRRVLVSFDVANASQIESVPTLAPLFAHALHAKIQFTVNRPGKSFVRMFTQVATMNFLGVQLPPTRMELEVIIQDRVNFNMGNTTLAILLQRYNFLTLRFVFQGLPAEYIKMVALDDYKECSLAFPGRLEIQNAAPMMYNERDEWEKDLGTPLDQYRLCPQTVPPDWVAARLEGSRQKGWHLGRERSVCTERPWLKHLLWTTKLCDVVRAPPARLPLFLTDSRQLIYLSTLPGDPCMHIATVRRGGQSAGAGPRTGYYIVYNPKQRKAAEAKVESMRGPEAPQPRVVQPTSRRFRNYRVAPEGLGNRVQPTSRRFRNYRVAPEGLGEGRMDQVVPGLGDRVHDID